jgi:hypothetical protein
MDHPYDTEITVFPDGRSIKTTLVDLLDFSSDETLEVSIRMVEAQLQARTAGARFVLDTLERLDQYDEAGLLASHLDLSRGGILGHSFGARSPPKPVASTRGFRLASISTDVSLAYQPKRASSDPSSS